MVSIVETACKATMAHCKCDLDAQDDHKIHICLCEGSWNDIGDIFAWPNLMQDGSGRRLDGK